MRPITSPVVIGMLCLGLMGSGARAERVVGVYNIPLRAAVSNKLTFVGLPVGKLPVGSGMIDTCTANTISCTGVAWCPGGFASGGSAAGETGISTYYVEIVSGTHEGRHFYITSNTSNSLTVAGALPASGLAGAHIEMIPAMRIRDIFGEPGIGDARIRGGTSSSDADYVRLWDRGTETWSAPIFYLNDGPNPPYTWVQAGYAVPDLIIDRDEGMLVTTIGAAGRTDFSLPLVGLVVDHDRQIVLAAGYSVLGGGNGVDVAIGDAGLDPPTLLGGSGSSTADAIYAWNSAVECWMPPAFYSNAGRNPAYAWVRAGIVDDTFILGADGAHLFHLNASTHGHIWVRPNPLVGE